MIQAPHFVAVGAVVADRTPQGLTPGGTAFYAASTARALGFPAAAATHRRDDFDLAGALPGIALALHADCDLTFSNVYGPAGRVQRVEGDAPLLTAAAVPPAWRGARAALLGPVFGEVDPALALRFPAAKVAVTPQGWMRRAGPDGCVERIPWTPPDELLARVDAVILSEEDLSGDREAEKALAARCRLLVVTRGERGCTVYRLGCSVDVPGYPVAVADPTGAGDVFAAAFLLKLMDDGLALQAARFANAVASFSVQAPGVTGLPTLAQVRARMASQEDRYDSGAAAG